MLNCKKLSPKLKLFMESIPKMPLSHKKSSMKKSLSWTHNLFKWLKTSLKESAIFVSNLTPKTKLNPKLTSIQKILISIYKDNPQLFSTKSNISHVKTFSKTRNSKKVPVTSVSYRINLDHFSYYFFKISYK